MEILEVGRLEVMNGARDGLEDKLIRDKEVRHHLCKC